MYWNIILLEYILIIAWLVLAGVSNMAYFADENQNHNNSGNSWKSSSSEGSRDMQPFLQNSNNATLSPQSSEAPKYLELLADNEDVVLRENPTNGYEVPRSIHISDQNLANISSISCTSHDRKSSLPVEITGKRKESTAEGQKQSDRKLYKRSSIASLNLPDRKGTSISEIPEKCNTLDGSKSSVNSIARATLKRDSFSSLNGQRKYKTSLNERRDSEASIGNRSCSSHSLAPSTRPSSSLINSQTILPTCLKGNVIMTNVAVNGEVPSNENTVAKNTLPKVQRTSNLQNGKANIPLVINSALLNLLRRQTPVVEDGSNIVTYTNINADAVKVNGS